MNAYFKYLLHTFLLSVFFFLSLHSMQEAESNSLPNNTELQTALNMGALGFLFKFGLYKHDKLTTTYINHVNKNPEDAHLLLYIYEHSQLNNTLDAHMSKLVNSLSKIPILGIIKNLAKKHTIVDSIRKNATSKIYNYMKSKNLFKNKEYCKILLLLNSDGLNEEKYDEFIKTQDMQQNIEQLEKELVAIPLDDIIIFTETNKDIDKENYTKTPVNIANCLINNIIKGHRIAKPSDGQYLENLPIETVLKCTTKYIPYDIVDFIRTILKNKENNKFLPCSLLAPDIEESYTHIYQHIDAINQHVNTIKDKTILDGYKRNTNDTYTLKILTLILNKNNIDGYINTIKLFSNNLTNNNINNDLNQLYWLIRSKDTIISFLGISIFVLCVTYPIPNNWLRIATII
jgi:hypothetical protein